MVLYLVTAASTFSRPILKCAFYTGTHWGQGFYFLFFFYQKSEGFNYKIVCSYFWNNKWNSLVGFTFLARGCLAYFFPNSRCLILKWNPSMTFIQYLMFMHVECFILLNANRLLYPYGWPFETFWEASSFVLRATRRSWIFHFLMRLLPVITRLCSPRTYYYRRYTLRFRHTHSYTLHLSHVPECGFAHIPAYAHTNPGRLFIY